MDSWPIGLIRPGKKMDADGIFLAMLHLFEKRVKIRSGSVMWKLGQTLVC